MSPGPRVLVISGSMGAGKTTVLGEASDLLTDAGIVHAACDMDSLCSGNIPGGSKDELLRTNLAAIWQGYAQRGVDRLLLSEPVETAAMRELIREAVGASELRVGRLRAPLAVMQARVRGRDPGMHVEQFVARVTVLEDVLDRNATADFEVDNGSRDITHVAREVLARAGWL